MPPLLDRKDDSEHEKLLGTTVISTDNSTSKAISCTKLREVHE